MEFIGQDIHYNRKIDIFNQTTVGRIDSGGCKIQNGIHMTLHKEIRHPLCRGSRGGDDADFDVQIPYGGFSSLIS